MIDCAKLQHDLASIPYLPYGGYDFASLVEYIDSCESAMLDKILKLALESSIASYDSATHKHLINPQQLEAQAKLVAQALEKGASLEGITRASLDVLEIAANSFLKRSPDVFLKFVLNTTTDSNMHIITDLVRRAIEAGANLNVVYVQGMTVFDMLVMDGQFANIEIARRLNPETTYTLSILGSISVMSTLDMQQIFEATPFLPNNFEVTMRDVLRARGYSNSETNFLTDLYRLAMDYQITARTSNSPVLTSLEMTLLNRTAEALPLDRYLHQPEMRNNYGFAPFALAMFGRKLDLAIQMLSINNEIAQSQSNSGMTHVQISTILRSHNSQAMELVYMCLSVLPSVDIELKPSTGETLVDEFLRDPQMRDEMLKRSSDSVYALIKPDADLSQPSKNPYITNIAISFDDGLWSAGVIAWSRLVARRCLNVEFYIVTPEILGRGGLEFASQFDGWINPGADDSYPKTGKSFSKQDCSLSLSIEKFYQTVLSVTQQLHIPYLGMCAGAQHLILHHGGRLFPLEGYDHGQHSIRYLEGTLAHFLAMTKNQQNFALKHCEFPTISVTGDTAHHYAAVHHNLGTGMQLGAVSEDGVPMAYAHVNNLRFATQFHPEHHYNVQIPNETNHEETWLTNFVDIAKRHHSSRIGEAEHPEELFARIQSRLSECFIHPACIGTNSTLLIELEG